MDLKPLLHPPLPVSLLTGLWMQGPDSTAPSSGSNLKVFALPEILLPGAAWGICGRCAGSRLTFGSVSSFQRYPEGL